MSVAALPPPDLGHTLLRHRQARYVRLGSQISGLMSLWRPLSLLLSSRTKASTTGNRDLACLSLRDKRRRITVTKTCQLFPAFAFAHPTRTCIPALRQTLEDPRFISAWGRLDTLSPPTKNDAQFRSLLAFSLCIIRAAGQPQI